MCTETTPKDDLYWFCSDCNKSFFDEYINKLDRSANFIGFKQNTKNGENEKKKIEKSKATKLKLQNKKEHERTNKLKKDEDEEDLEEIIVVPDEGEDQTKKDQECKFWADKGRCIYGEICHYKHSNKCQNIMTNGDCQDRNCKKNHPEVCYSMQQSGQCDRENCKFVHKKNRNITKRQRRSPNPRRFNSNYNNFYNRYQNQNGYDNDFFGYNTYNRNQWNMGMPMRRNTRPRNMRNPNYQIYRQPYPQPWEHPYVYEYPPIY